MPGRGERNVGNVALAIGGNARAGLPGGLGVDSARASTAGP